MAPSASPRRAWASEGIAVEVTPHFKSGFCPWLRRTATHLISARNQGPAAGIDNGERANKRAQPAGSLLYRPNLGTTPCPHVNNQQEGDGWPKRISTSSAASSRSSLASMSRR